MGIGMSGNVSGLEVENTSQPSPVQNSSSEGGNSTDDDYESAAMENSLRSIIRVLTSGSNSISLRASQDSDSDDDDVSSGEIPYNYRPPPAMKPSTPDTSKIAVNEISLLTGGHEPPTSRRHSAVTVLQDRSIGRSSVSQTRKRLISNVLPDTETRVAAFKNKVFCGVHGRDGDIFLSACQDRILRVYDTSQGNFKLLQSIQARDVGWSVLDVALSPDGSFLVYSSWNDYLYQVHILGDGYSEEGYSVEQVSLCLDPPGYQQFCIFSVKFSADSSEILGGANDGCIYLYDREANTQSLSIHAHERDVNAVCFVDQTTHIVASGGDDGLCKVWDRRSLRESNPKPVGVLAGHRDGIAYLDPRGDGRFLISNSKDQSIKLWDIRRFSNPSDVEEHKKAVRVNLQWDYRWERVPKSVTKQPQLAGDSSVMTYSGHSVLQTLIRCHFSPTFSTGQRYIYTGCASGRVVVYDVLTGEIVQVLSGHRACVRDVSWHPFLPEILSSSWDFTVNKWEHKGEAQEEFCEQQRECWAPSRKRSRCSRSSGVPV